MFVAERKTDQVTLSHIMQQPVAAEAYANLMHITLTAECVLAPKAGMGEPTMIMTRSDDK